MTRTATMSNATDIDNIGFLVSEINACGEGIVQGSDESARNALIDAAERLLIAARTPGENLYLLCSQPFFNGSVGAAYTLGCFDHIQDSNSPTTAEYISSKSGAEKLVIVRVMRVLTSSHIFEETAPETYMHNHMSRILSNPANRALFYIQNNILGPVGASLGPFLESHNLSSPTSHADAPFQCALKTELDFWAYIREDPFRSRMFNQSMHSAIVGASGIPPFPFEKIERADDGRTFIVDIGGGKGQVLKIINSKFPGTKGKMVLQDQVAVIAEARDSSDLPSSISLMSHDFFTPQPIQAAKVYFLRRVLHDWGDEAAKSILRNIIPAMHTDSRILINELVLPDYECDRRMAMNDMVMMSFGGMERSERQWQALLSDVGLEIKKIWRDQREILAVIEAVLTQSASADS